MQLKDSIVVITGASGNLGLALCERFGRGGVAQVVGLDREGGALDRLHTYLYQAGIPFEGKVVDITDAVACRAAVADILAQWGRIDVLINNAGVTHIQPFREMDPMVDTVRKVMEVNLFGAVYLSQAALPSLIERRGMIINISSVAGFAPLYARTAYAASKHALHGFFESLRTELRDEGVQCLMVCPSFVLPQSPILDLSGSSIYQAKKTTGTPLSPVYIADQVFESARRDRRLLVLGKTGKMAYWMQRFFPRLYERMMLRRIR